MSLFSPHASAPAAVRVVQRTMYVQVVWAAIYIAVNLSRRSNPLYYHASLGLIGLQVLIALGVLGAAGALGQLRPWALPLAFVVEAASLILGIYALTDSHSGLSAAFILAIFNLYRLSQPGVRQALQAGPQPLPQWAPQQYAPPPQPQWGAPQQPYGTPYAPQPPAEGGYYYGNPQPPQG